MRALFLVVLLAFTVSVSAEDWSKQYATVVKKHLMLINIVVESVGEETQKGSCSGVVVAQNRVLSAAHCFFEHGMTKTGYYKGKKVGVVKVGPEDLMLLDVDTKGKEPINIPFKGPAIGSPVAAIGHAMGDKNPMISPQTIMGYERGHVSTNNMFFPGFSGGPVVDLKGNLVGIMVLTNSDWNFSQSIDLATIHAFLYEEGSSLGDPHMTLLPTDIRSVFEPW